MKKKNALLLLLVVLVTSCGRKGPDLSRLQLGDYYVAQSDGRDVVLYVEEATKKSFDGRWYAEDSRYSEPNYFTATKSGRELKSPSLVAKADAMPGGDTLVLDVLLDGSWQTLRFLPWQQPSMNLDRLYPFYDSLYKVTCDEDVRYASAKGYWVSYPEPDGSGDNYLSIVLDKVNRESLTQQMWDLEMDVYRPDTRDASPRPLLMLIHGGAFFNGDKQAAGYEEWGRYFASRGYIVASINYRIGFVPIGADQIDRAGYRAVQDAYAAMCYLLNNPRQYPIDPNYLFVGGTSAGGITALNLAFMRDKDRPKSTKSGFINVVSGLYNHLASRFSEREHKDIGKEDLGGVNTVAIKTGRDVNFKINTVVNMWGAVHETSMLDNSPNTAILSFHGDADSVVAYGHDYPFTKVKTPVRDFINSISRPLEKKDSWISKSVGKYLGETAEDLKPINQFLCNEMYGSKCIHDKALSKGMKSELHTKAGGGHSLHVNDDGSLSDYYTLITDTTTRFLYLRMFPRPTLNDNIVGHQQWFVVDNAGTLKDWHLEAEGGLVLEAEPGKARVIFFSDAPEHKLRIVGEEKNGNIFNEDYDVDTTL